MRKQSLRQTANRYLRTDNRGSFKEKKRRSYVIHKMIDDLFIVGIVPSTWQSIQPEHLQQLVIHWKKRKLKDATIMRHMTIIRGFLSEMGCEAVMDIGNITLGLKRKTKLPVKPKVSFNFWQETPCPSSRLLIGLQTEFGLNLSEAIRLCPELNIQDHSLWITREMASNSRDRMIPIRNETQCYLIAEFKAQVKDNHNLIQTHGYQTLLCNYRLALAKLKLSSTINYRYLYARQLKKHLTPVISNYELTWIIMEEMGLSSRTTVWNYLNE